MCDIPLFHRVGLLCFDQVLRSLSIALAAAVIVRVLHQHLFLAPLRSLVWMLAAVLVRDAILSVPSYTSHAYTAAWEWTLPVLLIFQIWAGLDTLLEIARLYPKLGRFMAPLYLTCLAVSVIVCCLILPLELHRLSGGEISLRLCFLLQRCIDTCIAGVLLLASIFLAGFPAPSKQPPRNLVLHTILLTLYFGGYAVLFLAENLTALGHAVLLERAQFLVVVLVYAIWAIGISQEGRRSEGWPRIKVIVLQSVGAAKE